MRVCRSLLALTVLAASSGAAGAACNLGRLVELPVMMDQQVPIVTANINGTDVPFVADSGSFWSLISASAAANLKLRESPAPWGLRMQGIGGEFGVHVATIDKFTLANIPFQKIEFLVGGTEHGTRAIGLLGQNVFRIGDVEYDLANGVIRLMRAHDCKNANFAYWTKSDEYSEISIEASSAGAPHTIGEVRVSGTKLRALFDTRASRSVLSRRAAERAGSS
jgi:predicted aspartyl protease